MLDADLVGETLEVLSDPGVARHTRKEVKTLKGIRGTPMGEVARVGAAAWGEGITLDRDEAGLQQLFGQAWEDGLVAIGLLSALVPDRPGDCLDIGQDWLTRVDDLTTADALGWLVLAPAALASGTDVLEVLVHPQDAPVPVRRAGMAGGLALCGAVLEGPSAAPLRARLEQEQVAFVAEAHNPVLVPLCTHYVRDPAPHVRKVLRRVLRAWALSDPEATQGWMDGVKGGIPRQLREPVEKAVRKGRRLAARSE